MTEKEFIEKYDNGTRFTKEELREVLLGSFQHIETTDGEKTRIHQKKATILKFVDRYFCLEWAYLLKNTMTTSVILCSEQPYEVLKTYARKRTKDGLIGMTEWLPIKKGEEDGNT